LVEVESLRRVTLDKTQLKQLRALAPEFPKRVGVASSFVDNIPDSRFSLWPDQVNGLWLEKKTVAIPQESLNGSTRIREFSTSLNTSDAVLLDTRGGYSIGSRKVDDRKLAATLDHLAGREIAGADFYIFILRPPVLSNPTEELAVRNSIAKLARMCEERGLGCRVGG
jgi:hypothetical protein